MTTLVDQSPDRTEHSAAHELRTSTAAMRLSFTWFGTRKTLSPEQKAQAAETFGAEGDYLSAGKKLLNTKHPKFKAVKHLPLDMQRPLRRWPAFRLESEP